jgi:diacylglycerol kinase family enzyme
MKRLFIINAKAGGRRALQSWRSERERFASEFESGVAKEWIPQSLAELGERIVEFLSAGFDEWIIFGGDGTWHAVANRVLAHRESAGAGALALPVFRIASAGSGSDYARSLSEGAHVAVDVVRVALDGGAVRYFLNMASAGLSAQVAAAKERLPNWLPRSLCYAVPTLTEVWGAAPFRATLALDSAAPLSGWVWGIFLSKGRFAGGAMRFGYTVLLDDGQLEISWVEDQSALSILAQLPKLYGAGLREESGIRKFRAVRGVVSFAEPQDIEMDGEVARTQTLSFEVIPASRSAIRVARF